MKHVLAVILLVLASGSAFAGTPINCKKIDEAFGQGYEVRISASGRTASIINKGVRVATLKLVSEKLLLVEIKKLLVIMQKAK